MLTPRARRVAILSTVGAIPLFALAPGAPANADPVTQEFSVPGALDFTVPAGVCSIQVTTGGAAGGYYDSGDDGINGFPGLGASATGTVTVTPGELLVVVVGGQGENLIDTAGSQPPGQGGFNGGADGGTPLGGGDVITAGGAGGGGASDVRRGGSGLANRVIVGGGGGGAGAFTFERGAGGNGGDPDGDDGDDGSNGDGGISGGGGEGGTTTAGGAAGFDSEGSTTAEAGALGTGGTGGTGTELEQLDYNGGGGGSSFGPAGTVFDDAATDGSGRVSITYDVDAQPAGCGSVGGGGAVPVPADPRFTG